MIFYDCIMKNCVIRKGKDGSAVDLKYHLVLRDEVIECEDILVIVYGQMIDCKIEGQYNYFEFAPEFCKNVSFADDFLFREGMLKVNCNVFGGINMGNVINKFIAGLTMLNGDYKNISKEEVEKWVAKLKEIYNNLEIE